MRIVLLMTMIASAFIMSPPLVKGAEEVKINVWNADSSVKFALADLRSLPPEEQHYTRYFSLYNVPKAERKKMAETLSFVVNSLGTRRKIYIPLFIANSDETVVRVNIRNYEWNARIFDNLAKKGSGIKPFPEPYFHASKVNQEETEIKEETATAVTVGGKIEVIEQADCYRPGTNVVIAQFTTGDKLKVLDINRNGPIELILVNNSLGNGWIYGNKVKKLAKVKRVQVKEKKIFSPAPWLNPTAITELMELTQSESPVLRADWFIINALLPPAYYDFLRLGKKGADFEKLVFADEKKADKARSKDKAVVIQSMVARNNRTLTRSPTFTKGYYWVSHDSLTSVDDRKYIQNFLDEKFDATEDIGTLPNGLQAYFVTDGKDNRLDFANPDIAIDNSSVDRIVRTGRSCIICHAEGIRPIKDEIRTLNRKLANRESVKLLVINEDDAYRIEDQFSSNIDKQIIADQQIYADAIAETNGLTPPDNAKQYAGIYDNYAEKLLSKEIVARDVGLPIAELEKCIRLSNDPVLLGLVNEPIRPVRRDQFEESFQYFMLKILPTTIIKQAVPVHNRNQ